LSKFSEEGDPSEYFSREKFSLPFFFLRRRNF